MKSFINIGTVLGSFFVTLMLLGFISNPQDGPISLAEFNKRIASKDKITLVYFHASWCGICVKMKPGIDELEQQYKDKVNFLRIDTDRDKEVTREFEVDALPVLIIYKNGERKWVYAGLTDKNTIKANIDVNL